MVLCIVTHSLLGAGVALGVHFFLSIYRTWVHDKERLESARMEWFHPRAFVIGAFTLASLVLLVWPLLYGWYSRPLVTALVWVLGAGICFLVSLVPHPEAEIRRLLRWSTALIIVVIGSCVVGTPQDVKSATTSVAVSYTVTLYIFWRRHYGGAKADAEDIVAMRIVQVITRTVAAFGLIRRDPTDAIRLGRIVLWLNSHLTLIIQGIAGVLVAGSVFLALRSVWRFLNWLVRRNYKKKSRYSERA